MSARRPVRLTRRGWHVLTAALMLLGALAGFTAQTWNPCAAPGTVCSLEVAP
jgi:hypothetical protein